MLLNISHKGRHVKPVTILHWCYGHKANVIITMGTHQIAYNNIHVKKKNCNIIIIRIPAKILRRIFASFVCAGCQCLFSSCGMRLGKTYLNLYNKI